MGCGRPGGGDDPLLFPAWAPGRTALLTELENWGSSTSSQGPEVSFDVLNWSPGPATRSGFIQAQVRAGDLGGFSVQAAADIGKGRGPSHQGKRGRRKDQTETWKRQHFRAERKQSKPGGRARGPEGGMGTQRVG